MLRRLEHFNNGETGSELKRQSMWGEVDEFGENRVDGPGGMIVGKRRRSEF